jgi:hypothetical protein
MYGLAAPALAPALALVSTPSLLTLAVIGASTVVVYEARRLARRLLAPMRPAPAMTPLPGAGIAGDASGRDRDDGSPAVPAVAASESGHLAPSRAPHASRVAVAPPRAPRRASDRQLALASLVVAGLATAWLVRGWSGRPSSKSV